ncbi:MAG: hypothetical protein SGJ05_09760 [bacterium]|nr:hypothetical protein [bacterium]
MRTKHDLEQALRDLRRDQEPLMSRDAIKSLLAAHPITSAESNAQQFAQSSSRPTQQSSRTRWIVGAGLTVAATVALVVINTTDDTTQIVNNTRPGISTDQLDESNQTDASKRDLAIAQSPVEPEGVYASGNSTSPSGPKSESRSATGSRLGAPAKTSDLDDGRPTRKEIPEGNLLKQSAKRNPLATETIRLSAQQLVPFGLTYESEKIVYNEGGERITIRANGVAATSLKALNAQQTEGPVMVIVYHDEKHFSSWWDRTDPKIDPAKNQRSATIQMNTISPLDGLVAIRVPIERTGTLASKVDVVLWFVATKQLAERLPEPYRRQLLAELDPNDSSTPTHYTEPDGSSTTLVAASKIFPNPLSSGVAYVRMEMKRAAVSTAIITDMFGREIATAWRTKQFDKGQSEDMPLFRLENAPTGVYNVVITFDGSNEQIVQRLMIQR